MRNSPITLKVLCYPLSAFIFSCFLSCNGDHTQRQRNRTAEAEVKEIKSSRAQIFLAYLDALVKLPDAKFSEAELRSINKKYASQLPLVMYDSTQEQSTQDIVIHYYKNNQLGPVMESGIRFLVPETLTDSLVVSDFTRYFGNVEDEKPLIGITKQPLSVHIKVSSDREMKLTRKNNINKEQAGVTMVDIFNYR
ncbi:hypothetical protein [Chryseobacterium camelliae]|uniref:hypothetical protein n=1 Tax=Chryseobacterium camelliae TaxID=1265445 RepID=UPI002861FCEB|nr:hypothetical protein [Chryseobacterium camelliae]MDR6515819.1 hypothetical protein [Chryseobacterium camelliae]